MIQKGCEVVMKYEKVVVIRNSNTEYFPPEAEKYLKQWDDEKKQRMELVWYIERDARSYACTSDMFNAKEVRSCSGHFMKVLGIRNWFFSWNPVDESVVGYEIIDVDTDQEWFIDKSNDTNECIRYGKK